MTDHHHFATLIFDDALIAKYNTSAPRYTSYPTALEFAPIADGAEAQILCSRNPDTPLSLYVHIPFCRHLCYYCGCNKIITKKNSDAGDYLDYVFAEIRHKKSLLAGTPIVKQIHLGGGTPTFLSDDELVALWDFFGANFKLDPDGDYSVEIDPRELRRDTLSVLKGLGVNRLSFGVQDLNETVQIAVNRIQPTTLVEQVMAQARELGFGSVNIDLIYGLPHQTPKSFAKTLDAIIALAPERLSVFNYAHLPERFAPQKRIREQDLPSPTDKLAMFKDAILRLIDAGYQYVGIDHFAKPTDALAIAQQNGKLHRNFQGYTILGECDLLGFGVSSISQIGRHITQNPTALADYQAKIQSNALPAIKHIQSNDKDDVRKDVIMNLLCHERLVFDVLDGRFNIDSRQYFADELIRLQQMADDGLVQISDWGVQILPKGRILARTVAQVFDEYATQKHAQRFSRVI